LKKVLNGKKEEKGGGGRNQRVGERFLKGNVEKEASEKKRAKGILSRCKGSSDRKKISYIKAPGERNFIGWREKHERPGKISAGEKGSAHMLLKKKLSFQKKIT